MICKRSPASRPNTQVPTELLRLASLLWEIARAKQENSRVFSSSQVTNSCQDTVQLQISRKDANRPFGFFSMREESPNEERRLPEYGTEH